MPNFSFYSDQAKLGRRTRHAIIYRYTLSRRYRIVTIAWSAVAIVVLMVIGYYLPRSIGGPHRNYGGALMAMSLLPGLCIVLHVFAPNVTTRISDTAIQQAQTYPRLKRQTLAWRDVERMRFGKNGIVLQGRKQSVGLLDGVSIQIYQANRKLLVKHLSSRFDLSEPGFVEFRNAARGDRWWPVCLLILAVHAVMLPIAFTSPDMTMFSIIGGLVLITLILVGWHGWRLQRMAWRYPREQQPDQR